MLDLGRYGVQAFHLQGAHRHLNGKGDNHNKRHYGKAKKNHGAQCTMNHSIRRIDFVSEKQKGLQPTWVGVLFVTVVMSLLLFVEIVSNTMTLPAFGEVLMHGFRMRFAVTGRALRHHLMLLLVTGRAGEFGMLGRIVLQLGQNIIMAAGAT